MWKEKCIAGGGRAFFCGAKRKGYRLTPMIEREKKRKEKERKERIAAASAAKKDEKIFAL